MPQTSGIDALIAIRSEFPTAKITMLTTYGGDAQAQRALKAGAYSYVLKGLVRKELIETIRAAHAVRSGFIHRQPPSSPPILAKARRRARVRQFCEAHSHSLEQLSSGNT